MRLFIAILFSEKINRVLSDAVESLRMQSVSGSFTRPENFHLTLSFIGETEKTEAIRRDMDSCSILSFELSVGGSGQFGNLYWVGVYKTPELLALEKSLWNALTDNGFDVESRSFKPHITIARNVFSPVPVKLNVPKTIMTVNQISLMKSERTKGNLVYTEIYGKCLSCMP